MRDKDLPVDRTCHVLYSRPCKREILAKVALHYPPEQADAVWERIQRQYVLYLKDWRRDLGGKKNFHNGVGGTYDCIALMSYYVTCREVTSLAEIEAMEGNLFLPAFRRLGFVNLNRPLFQKLMHGSFTAAKRRCDGWNDYLMTVHPFQKGQPIRYEFTACPVAQFAKQHDLLEVMPAFCNPDFTAMAALHARLVRTTTCAIADRCDYAIYGDQEEALDAHPEYVDEQGYRRNR